MELWEILVPASNGKKKIKFSYNHHKEWDAFVRNISGGVTILKTGKGEWISPDGELFADRVIPCRVVIKSKEEIDKIINFTLVHYDQLAVMAYKISDEVIIRFQDLTNL